MSTRDLIIIVILISILIVAIVNVITLYYMKKSSVDKLSDISHERYFELKFRLQTFITIASIVIIVTGLLGIKTIDDLREGISEPLEKTLDTLKNEVNGINEILDYYKIEISNYNKDLSANKSDLKSIQKTEKSVSDGINQLSEEVEKIKSNINNLTDFVSLKNIYIIDSLKIRDEGKNRDTTFFQDLKTIDGKGLPDFNKPPAVIINPNLHDPNINDISVTCDYFICKGCNSNDDDYIQIIIIETN